MWCWQGKHMPWPIRNILLELKYGKDKENNKVIWEKWQCPICKETWKMHLSYYVLINEPEWCRKEYMKLIKEWNLKGIKK